MLKNFLKQKELSHIELGFKLVHNLSAFMNKLSLVVLFSAALALFPKLSGIAGTGSDDDILLTNIAVKYQELKKTAPVIKARGKVVAQSLRFIQPGDKILKDYSKLKQIALVRHGEPDMDKSGKYTSSEVSQFVKCYDSVCIIVPDQPFFEIGKDEEVKVFSSPINRALSTAQYLCGDKKCIATSDQFREFESSLKNKKATKAGKRLPVKFWTTTNRVKWMLGIGKHENTETFSEAKDRAKQAAITLAEASETNPKVLLTAHGFLNRYIKKNLEKMGWKVVEDTGSDYFGTTILVKIDGV